MKPRSWLRRALVIWGILALVAVSPLPGPLSPFDDELSLQEMQVGLAEVSGRTTLAGLTRDLAIIDPNHQLDPYLTKSERSVALYRDRGHRTLIAEVALRNDEGAPSPVWHDLVIDPGHWGGTWSQNEKRHITVGAGAPVREGDLTLSTALRVRAKLENVRLTRTTVATEAFPGGLRDGFDAANERRIKLGEDFGALLGWPTVLDYLRLWPERRTLSGPRAFEVYTHYDLRMRPSEAKADDVFVAVHYNVASVGQANGIMAFVYGDVLPGEASTPSQRYWAARHALDGNLNTSILLAHRFAWALQRRMTLPAIGEDPDQKIPNHLTLDARAGVHARNLAVLRRARGPAVLLEGPCMNDATEYPRFLSERVSADGVMVPVRAEEYADAIADIAGDLFAQSDL